jgi:hypothetical protein
MGYTKESLLQLLITEIASALNSKDDERVFALSVVYQRIASVSA